MKTNKYFSAVLTTVKLSMRKPASFSSSSLGVIVLLVLFSLVFSDIQGLANSLRAALVINFEGSSNDFWIHRNVGDRGTSVARGVAIRDGGSLNVPSTSYWASFAFTNINQAYDPQTYAGLIVRTRNRGRYTFPCTLEGEVIIAWSGSSDGARACSAGDAGIQINRPLRRASSHPINFIETVARAFSQNTKQNSTEQSNDDLAILPGNGRTVIRTTNTPFTTFDTEYPLEQCTPEETARGQGDWCRRQREVTIEGEAVKVEVLEGDVLIQSEQNSDGVRVREGQEYSYPGGRLAAIDAEGEANSCEILRFLNAAYWSSPDTPESISDGIAEQLKQHREVLGVSGRPPSNLAALEQSILNELNRLRSNPGAYADELERQKRFYYENWSKLPGETIDPSLRVSAVDEAIAFVRSQRTLPPFSVSTGMSRASQDHVNDQGRTGRNFGHTGDDRSGYWDRLRRYGTVGCVDGENVSYYDPSLASSRQSEAQVAVVELLINDGQRQGGDRDNIFNPDFQVMGVACGSHGPFLREMCVVTYAAGYVER